MNNYFIAVNYSLVICGIMIVIGLPYLFIKDIGWRKVFEFILMMGICGTIGVLIVFYSYVFLS